MKSILKYLFFLVFLAIGFLNPISAQTINAPTIAAGTSLCNGESITVAFTKTGTYNAGNIFSVQLSDASGSFAAPVVIGSLASTANSSITSIIPVGTIVGAAYRVRIVSTNPVVTSAIFASNITIGTLSGDPTIYGNGEWNSYCYHGTTATNYYGYYGYYTESSLSFDTRNRWATTSGPCVATSGSGSAYVGCTLPATTNYTICMKRTNIPCGYYQVDVNFQDDGLSFWVDGVKKWENTAYTTATQSAVWTGFLGPSSNVEFRLKNDGGGGGLKVTLTPLSSLLSITPPTTVCASTSTTIVATNNTTATVNYSWSPAATLNNSNTATVIATPASTTTYTITATDVVTGCPISNSVTITVANPVTVITPSTTACSVTSPTFVASGANTYTWSPATGLNTTTGNTVIATPSIQTTYTVTGSNNCTTSTATVTVNAPPASPATTTYGNGTWNVFTYNDQNFTTYYGYYTENNLSFDTQNRYATASAPSTATGYDGCSVSATSYSLIMKRTNISCGYYQLDVNYQDDGVSFWIDGVKKWENTVYTSTLQSNVWQGFISPSMNVEFRFKNTAGPGRLKINLATISGLTISPPVTVCANTPTTIVATNSTGATLNYSWTPAATLDNSNTATVIATPAVTTSYTVVATDVATGCFLTNSVIVSTSAVAPVTIITPSTNGCSASSPTYVASGANSYTWAPATGLNTTTGNTVIATPTTTTTYTVTGSNNCLTSTASVTVIATPALPVTTYGNGVWNVFTFNDQNFTNYYGYYTESNLSFDTQNKWATANAPSTTTGYDGCSVSATSYSLSAKRTNIPCGYYKLDLNYHDDGCSFWIDGVKVWENTVFTATLQSNVWQGFINPSMNLEVRLKNTAGNGRLKITLQKTTAGLGLTPPVLTCSTNSTTTLTATNNTGLTLSYLWSPAATLDNSTSASVVATPLSTTTYLLSATDAISGCSIDTSVVITVSNVFTTVVSPTTSYTSSSVILTASGANTYSWSPATGLNTTTGANVIASPSATTTYTVTGFNNCTYTSATTTVTVLPAPTVFPTGTWNAYCYNGFNTTAIGNYYGYYTENGSGASGYNFNTSTKWPSTAGNTKPSNANATNGLAYIGNPTLPATNWTISFKRTGFTCGIYTINILDHDDNITLKVNGVQVVQHAAYSGAHSWTGSLCSTSTVEFILAQGTGIGILSVTFVPIAQPASQLTWVGATSNDWFTSSNWCGSASAIPTASTDVLIPAAGPAIMPSITTTGAACKDITINPAIASSTYNSAVAAATLSVTGTNSLSVNGNWNNSGVLNSYQSTITYNGSTGTTLSSVNPETFYNVVINNPNNVTVASGSHVISNNLNFAAGKLIQNSTLEIGATSSISNTNSSSYIEGAVTKTGNTAFTFPVGKNGKYRPISISAPSAVTDQFTAQYFEANPLIPYPKTLKDASLIDICSYEYWILNRTTGTSNVNVTLMWNNAGAAITDYTDLVVARFDGATSTWKNHGNGGTTGNNTTGTIVTSAPVTSFSPFTLASISVDNPLPIKLVDFVAKQKDEFIDLNWTTASEIRNDKFVIEKSLDGVSFVSIGTIAGSGNSNKELDYSLIDEHPIFGKNYYRLLQIDYDGTKSYSDVISIDFKGIANHSDLKVYPNPSTGDKIFLTYSLPNLSGKDYISIENALGVTIYKIALNSFEETIEVTELSSISKGIYTVKLYTPTEILTKKIIID